MEKLPFLKKIFVEYPMGIKHSIELKKKYCHIAVFPSIVYNKQVEAKRSIFYNHIIIFFSGLLEAAACQKNNTI